MSNIIIIFFVIIVIISFFNFIMNKIKKEEIPLDIKEKDIHIIFHNFNKLNTNDKKIIMDVIKILKSKNTMAKKYLNELKEILQILSN